MSSKGKGKSKDLDKDQDLDQDQDKRKEKRFAVNATVIITGTKSKEVVYGVCWDVSETGLKVKTNNPLPKDKTLQLEIDDQVTIVTAEAKAAFIEEKDGSYITGLKAKFETDNKLDKMILKSSGILLALSIGSMIGK